MAKRSLSVPTVTCIATADATNLVDGSYPFAMVGAAGAQRTDVIEVSVGGQAAASTPQTMLFSRDSTVAATVGATTTRDAALDPATAALAAPVVVGNFFTTKPQRSATLQLLTIAFNAFGGIYRWVAAPDEQMTMVGNTASLGAFDLSSLLGAGAVAAHCIYETK